MFFHTVMLPSHLFFFSEQALSNSFVLRGRANALWIDVVPMYEDAGMPQDKLHLIIQLYLISCHVLIRVCYF